MNSEFTHELIKSADGQHSLVLWHHNTYDEFVVCSYYNNMKPIGSQWLWGHYFRTLKDAMDEWTAECY